MDASPVPLLPREVEGRGRDAFRVSLEGSEKLPAYRVPLTMPALLPVMVRIERGLGHHLRGF
jgi:hypothetical protein